MNDRKTLLRNQVRKAARVQRDPLATPMAKAQAAKDFWDVLELMIGEKPLKATPLVSKPPVPVTKRNFEW